MDGFLIFLFLILVAGVIWRVIAGASSDSLQRELHKATGQKLDRVLAEIADLRRQVEAVRHLPPPQASETPAPAPAPPQKATAEADPALTPVPEMQVPTQVSPAQALAAPEVPLHVQTPEEQPERWSAPAESIPVPATQPASRTPKATRGWQSQDLEKFVGENLANKIGILILVLGIGFFVKYAIDQNWIPDWGRVLIGIIAGLGLIGTAHRLRRNYPAFGSVLTGGGLAVLYLSIGIAFHLYELFGVQTAFGGMVAVTLGGVLLSLSYNRQELAVLALLGGLGTPLFVSTGQGDYRILFTYLLVLTAGMALLTWHRRWTLVNIVAYVGTTLLYIGWLFNLNGELATVAAGALVFATLQFGVFLAMQVLYCVRWQLQLRAVEVILLLANSLLFLACGLYLLAGLDWNGGRGVFAASLAVVHFGVIVLLRKRVTVQSSLLPLLQAIGIGLIAIALPLQTQGPVWPMAWALQLVVLLEMWRRNRQPLLYQAAEILFLLLLMSVLIRWGNVYQLDMSLSSAPSGMAAAGFVVLVALQWVRRLLQRVPADTPSQHLLAPPAEWANLLTWVVPTLAVVVPWLELNRLVQAWQWPYPVQVLVLSLFLWSSLVVLQVVYLRADRSRHLFAVLLAALLVGYGAWTLPALASLSFSLASAAGAGILFGLAPVLWVLALAALVQVYVACFRERQGLSAYVTPLVVIGITFVLSAALVQGWSGLLGTAQTYDTLSDSVMRAGWSVLWGVLGFALIVGGIQWRDRWLRVLALVLLALTIGKLFVFDLADVSDGGRILAFICLGLVLLLVSFLYQRLKALVLDDSPGAAEAPAETPPPSPPVA